MAERRGIGRGLAAILPMTNDHVEHDELRQVPVAAVEPNPNQPRLQFDDDAIASLAESILANGVLQPLLVRPLAAGHYELIAGERRLRAAQMAGLETVPAYVRAGDDENTLELALIENMARVDLNAIDAARACAALVEDLGLSKEEVARRVGKSRVAVSNLIRLLNLPDEVIVQVERGELSEGHGRAILRAPDHFTRRRLAASAIEQGWSVRETERRAEQAADSQHSNGQVDGQSGAKTASQSDSAAPAARAELAERLSTLLGVDVQLRPNKRGVRAQIDFASVEDAVLFAETLDRP